MEDTGGTGGEEQAGAVAEPEAQDSLAEALETDKPAAKQSHVRAINTAKWAKGEAAMDELVKANPIRPKGDSESKPSEREASEPAPSDGPQRDPATGRFTSAARLEGQEAPPETKAEGQAPATPSPETTSPQTKITVGGREFADSAAADSYVQGLEFHVNRSTESALGWKSRADALEAELAALKGNANPAEPSSPEAATPPAGIDEELAATMWQLANEKGRPDLYFNWRAAEEAKVVEARMQAKLDELLGPAVQEAQQQQEHQAWQNDVRGVFTSLRQYRAADGISPAFPEVDSPETVYEMGKLMEQLGYTRDQFRTPTQVAAAIYTYRGWKAGFTPLAATPNVATTSAPSISDAAAVATGTEVPFNRADAPDGLSQEARWLRNSLALSRPTRVAASANGGRPVELGFSRR